MKLAELKSGLTAFPFIKWIDHIEHDLLNSLKINTKIKKEFHSNAAQPLIGVIYYYLYLALSHFLLYFMFTICCALFFEFLHLC